MSTDGMFEELYELLLAHQRAAKQGRLYYCWRSARIYNWLKRQEQESVYHAAWHLVRIELDQEEELARHRK